MPRPPSRSTLFPYTTLFRSRANWPAQMREEYGDDEGRSAGERHQAALKSHFRRAREELERFNPDVVIIFGDDQYENFKEGIIRSEEHTSELQSQSNLVCRLL